MFLVLLLFFWIHARCSNLEIASKLRVSYVSKSIFSHVDQVQSGDCGVRHHSAQYPRCASFGDFEWISPTCGRGGYQSGTTQACKRRHSAGKKFFQVYYFFKQCYFLQMMFNSTIFSSNYCDLTATIYMVQVNGDAAHQDIWSEQDFVAAVLAHPKLAKPEDKAPKSGKLDQWWSMLM